MKYPILVITFLLVAGAVALGYHWAFGKTKVHYATATVERGDAESTVVTPGILQFAAPTEGQTAASAPGLSSLAKSGRPLTPLISEPKAKNLKIEGIRISPKVAISPEIMTFPKGGGRLGVRAEF